MMFSNEIVIISGNVAIVQSGENKCNAPLTISVQELSEYYGTVSLPVAQSISVVDDQLSNIKLVFGSWAVSGDEDEQLDALYKSRLTSSRSLDD
ncbi:MAG: hypothetical protein AABY87_01630 [bacterium]